MNNKVLVINAGSSSIKWTLFNKSNLEAIASGLAERIGVDGNMEMKFGDKISKQVNMANHTEAVQEILNLWKEYNVVTDANEIQNIGFRVVQGGLYFNKATSLVGDAIEKIKDAGKYAPLHNPGAVLAIEAFQALMPWAKLSASFDTSFHSTIPQVNYTYPIDQKLAKELGIRKFGMHGISHMFITRKLEEILGKDKVNFVNLHIGNGASLCAVKDSQSYDTSMGLTPLAGIMMGTRSGDIDPSIHEFINVSTGMSIKDITAMLNKKSGLLGVSGVSSDMRDCVNAAAEGNKDAALAIEMYTQRVADYAITYMNKLDSVDAIVFTAGVGENSLPIREKIMSKFKLLNIKLDKEANASKIGDFALISAKDSAIPVYVIRTNEELMIAQEALSLEK